MTQRAAFSPATCAAGRRPDPPGPRSDQVDRFAWVTPGVRWTSRRFFAAMAVGVEFVDQMFAAASPGGPRPRCVPVAAPTLRMPDEHAARARAGARAVPLGGGSGKQAGQEIAQALRTTLGAPSRPPMRAAHNRFSADLPAHLMPGSRRCRLIHLMQYGTGNPAYSIPSYSSI
jgi:hypothetical protein